MVSCHATLTPTVFGVALIQTFYFPSFVMLMSVVVVTFFSITIIVLFGQRLLFTHTHTNTQTDDSVQQNKSSLLLPLNQCCVRR